MVPYVIEQTIIFLPCGFFFFLLFSSPISAVADWMSTILLHGVALVQISGAGLKRAERGSLKYRTQNSRQKSPSGHHRTYLSGYIFATKADIDNRKKKIC